MLITTRWRIIRSVNSVIAWLANSLLFAMAAVALLSWLLGEDLQSKKRSAAIAVIGLVIALLLLETAAGLHTDARPFVQNPSLHPLIKHSADNGFPSDHCLAAGLLTSVVIFRHRLTGLVLAAAAAVLAAARVAAHVHHLQDVLAGLALGALAGWLATILVDRVALRGLRYRSSRI
jgi:membrane-associated phospholipid phosphatase